VATIYVQLLGEAVDVWRPVQAEPVGDDTFRVDSTCPPDERWAVEPTVGDTVRCQQRTLSGGLAWVIMSIEPVSTNDDRPR
jgi:hypothetical protein